MLRRNWRPARSSMNDERPPPPGEDFPPLYRADVVADLLLTASDRMIYWRSVFYLYAGTHYRGLTDPGQLLPEFAQRLDQLPIDAADLPQEGVR